VLSDSLLGLWHDDTAPMAYNSTGLVVHDADAHIMETPTWLREYADPQIRERIDALTYPGGNELQQSAVLTEDRDDLSRGFDRLASQHASEEYIAAEADEIMTRKNFAATGSFISHDRPRALDHLGFASQLVFNTFHNTRLRDWEHAGDTAMAEGVSRAHNRGMAEFCAVDRRLLSTLYVPLADLERAPVLAAEALEMGAGALLIASGCPPTHSPSHVALDAVWAQAAEARVPVVFHVGGTGELLDPHYFDNGLPVPPDFHGGEENFRSVDYMAIPVQPAQTLATMIFDGVFERFPDLQVGVIEQGAVWVPSWMRQMESAVEAFGRHEERLQRLSLRPSDYVRRQMKFTPYPTEDVGWVVDQAGAGVVMFSSDYPHVEGGRRPIERFERSLSHCGDDVRQRFYHDNFDELMGGRLGALLAA
jgi:predicted TIM-barrel fold metal-dependent hydrolase